MKKRLLYLILLPAIIILSSCSLLNSSTDNSTNKETYTVTFEYNNGSTATTVKVLEGEDDYIIPNTPIKEGYLFDCWCYDEALTKEFNFTTDITSNVTLYAKYFVDYAYLTNKITTETMKANVSIINSSYSGSMFHTQTSSSTGSGIIFELEKIKNSYYYFVLTNNHVVYTTSSNVSYTIEDYLGNQYDATLVANDPNYDLAILYFKKDIDLLVIESIDENPSLNTEVVALGQPKGQTNAITYGTIQNYSLITLSGVSIAESNIQFQTIEHSAYLNSGSSGGALLNTDLKLIGINYAGATNSSGTFISGHSIPIEKVKEFVTLNGTSYNLTI